MSAGMGSDGTPETKFIFKRIFDDFDKVTYKGNTN